MDTRCDTKYDTLSPTAETDCEPGLCQVRRFTPFPHTHAPAYHHYPLHPQEMKYYYLLEEDREILQKEVTQRKVLL